MHPIMAMRKVVVFFGYSEKLPKLIRSFFECRVITNITLTKRTTQTPNVYIGVEIEISTPIHNFF